MIRIIKYKRVSMKYFSSFTIYFLCLMMIPSLKADFLRDDINEIVLDTSTNLMWQDDSQTIDEINTKKWEESLSFCEILDLAGYTDWHLPNSNELYGLADTSFNFPALSDDFQNVNSSYYWSSTTDASDTSSNAWSVNFSYGTNSLKDKDNSYNVRCVRLSD